MGFKLGDHDNPELVRFQEFMNRKFKSYSNLAVDNYYGYHERDVVNEARRRLVPPMPLTGEADDDFLRRIAFIAGPPPVVRSNTWVYSAAGTSAAWNVGPQFVIGHAAKEHGKEHQPVAYPAAGFLGMGGTDPQLSYLESITALKLEWARLLRLNTSGDIIVIGYSQSADGFLRAAIELFGDGGEFESQRHRLKRFIMMGDPCRQRGAGPAPGWGISRLILPLWLAPLVRDITVTGDLYACATDDTLVPLFYDWFIRAEVSLPFVFFSAQIVIPAIASLFNIAVPLIGVLGTATGSPLGAGGAAILAGVTGIGLPILLKLIEGFSGGPPPDPKLVEVLTAKGLLANLPKLIKTLVALATGIRLHGEYHLVKPEFGNRTGIDVGIALVNELP